MFIRYLLLASLIIGFFFSFSSYSFGALVIPGWETIIKPESIVVTSAVWDPIDVSRNFWLSVLNALKVIVSGFALIYLVLIGAYMVIFSENEEKIKTQKRQIIYALVWFLFLNIPWAVYEIFFLPDGARANIWDSATSTSNIFINATTFPGIFGGIVNFFEIFIFWVAIVTFTWWLFRLILSGGDEERQKAAKDRIIYGVLWLIFLWFVKVWWGVIERWDFTGEVATLGKKMLWLAVYFAWPIAIFFLVIGGYYYITSGGDEERMKKGKNIVINTFIAALILIGAYSFVSDLVNFTV